ncbi:hypothetical protein ACFLYK_03360 [Candidatus Cloacimonadota bacterium]
MCFIKWFATKAEKMGWLDYALTKLSVFFFTLFLIALWPDFRSLVLSFSSYWYLIISLIVAIPVLKKIFS